MREAVNNERPAITPSIAAVDSFNRITILSCSLFRKRLLVVVVSSSTGTFLKKPYP